MWITCITNFNDDKTPFFKGELRHVSDAVGLHVCKNAWAVPAEAPDLENLPEASSSTVAVDLDIQSSQLALGDNYG